MAQSEAAGSGKRKLKRKKKRTPQPAEVRYPELENMLLRLAELKAEGVEFTERHRTEFLPLEAKVIAFMEEREITVYEGDAVKGDRRQAHTTTLDWNGIQKDLPRSVWLSLLDPPQPSMDKLKAAMELGQVDPKMVEKHMMVTPNKAYILPTFKEH